MDYPEDPWNSPDLHKNHIHGPGPQKPAGESVPSSPAINGNGAHSASASSDQDPTGRTTSTFTSGAMGSSPGSVRQSGSGNSVSGGGGGGSWSYYDANTTSFNEPPNDSGPGAFGSGDGNGSRRDPGSQPPGPPSGRTIGGSGRTGSAIEETILVALMPEKEGMFMFQHHNYEVSSSRRGSKVIRRYSDFVWLLDCLHKRYPFRVLPLLPPKRVAGK